MGKPIVIKEGSVAVKIYRTRNGIYEHCELVYYRDGKRVREHKSSMADARSRAGDVIRLIASGNTDVASMSNADVATWRKALATIAPTGKSLEHALSEYMEMITALDGTGVSPVQAVAHFKSHRPELSAKTPDVVVELLAARKQDGVGNRHYIDLKSRLAQFGDAFPCPIANITGADIDRWLREQQASNNWHGQTRNHYRAAVSILMNFAATRRYLPPDWNEMRLVPRASFEPEGEVVIYTPEQAQQIMNAAQDCYRPYLALALFAGIRQAEITRMGWDDIWWDRGTIHVGRQKIRTAGHRYVPLHPNCAAWLRPLAKTSGAICSAGIAGKLVGIGHRAGVEWQHNAPRHSYISYRLITMGNADKVAGEVGNTKQMLDRHYRCNVAPDVAEKYFSVAPKVG